MQDSVKAIVKMPLSKFEKEMVTKVMQEVQEQTRYDQNKAIVRALKMACIILNSEFGFGIRRLQNFLAEMQKESDKVFETPERWFYIDEQLHQIGLAFDDEDISDREEHTRTVMHEHGRKFREW